MYLPFPKLIKQRKMDRAYAYEMGYACAIEGANLTNCDHRIFSTPENTLEWERGKKDGADIKAKAQQ